MMVMADLFPPDVGMSHVRGIVNIIRQNGGRVSISKLAEEAEEDVDDLLPLLEASNILGFVKVSRSSVKITERGVRLASGSPRSVIRESLVKIEPFKSAIKALAEGNKTTQELFEELSARNVFPKEGPHSSETLLKILLAWGVRSKLLSYNEQTDTWILNP